MKSSCLLYNRQIKKNGVYFKERTANELNRILENVRKFFFSYI